MMTQPDTAWARWQDAEDVADQELADRAFRDVAAAWRRPEPSPTLMAHLSRVAALEAARYRSAESPWLRVAALVGIGVTGAILAVVPIEWMLRASLHGGRAVLAWAGDVGGTLAAWWYAAGVAWVAASALARACESLLADPACVMFLTVCVVVASVSMGALQRLLVVREG